MNAIKSLNTENNLYSYNGSIEKMGYRDQLDSSLVEKDDTEFADDSLLELIIGVQHYLSDQAKIFNEKVTDSPLYHLQYKMYSYLRQKTYEV
ncbi:hypothetical protein BY458DRAFT_523240 [Sporodiniella umbellata]|nr:hypothetical protein BY458DRAFT_523240 [Sporodiniella umbellata]